MTTTREYYQTLAAAFVRGKLTDAAVRAAHQPLFTQPLEALSAEEVEQVIELGIAQGLRLHRFKRTMDLPRVRRVLGMLRGLQPASLLDVGSGRGAFLWPLLDAFPWLPVTTVDLLDYRVADMQAVHDGGVTRLSASRQDVTALRFADRSFDVVTMLEVLEHIPETEQALAEVCRVAERCVIFSVPSKADDNPEHIHLFTEQRLRALLAARGARQVNVSYVLNHMLVVATVTR
jgi:2-polyprenyl-3-methyl-5-hydroxy-6-metoxy-1,4-benzoquinol methylase